MREMIEKALAGILVVLFIATVLTVTWQVIGRYVLAAPSSATEEVARFLLIWLGTLSAAYAFARRMHVGVDLVTAKLSPAATIRLARMIWTLSAVFALGVMVFGGATLVNITRTLGQTSAAMGLPMWTIYTVMPISGLIIAYFAIAFLFEGISSEQPGQEEPTND